MNDCYIAAIAGSAGSHTPLLQFFDHTPHDDVSYVILRHLPLQFISQFEMILRRHSKLTVKEIRHGMVLKPDTIYIAPNKQDAIIRNNVFYLLPKVAGANRAADVFLRSMAENSGNRSIAVILSGLLQDGTEGVQAVRKAEGFVI